MPRKDSRKKFFGQSRRRRKQRGQAREARRATNHKEGKK